MVALISRALALSVCIIQSGRAFRPVIVRLAANLADGVRFELTEHFRFWQFSRLLGFNHFPNHPLAEGEGIEPPRDTSPGYGLATRHITALSPFRIDY